MVTKKSYSKLLIHCLEEIKPLFCQNIVIQPHWLLPLTPFLLIKLTKLELNFLYLRSICRHFLLWIRILLIIMPVCTARLDHFDVVTVEELTKIISCMNKTTCKSDPFPTKLLFSHLTSIISIILHINNHTF